MAQPTERPERPPGRLIWLHAPEEEHIRSLGVLAEKIRDEDGHPVLVTTPGSTAPAALAGGTLWQPSPGKPWPRSRRCSITGSPMPSSFPAASCARR
ncbi:hypothetical protein ACFSHQ_21845 [Gemmobacter lanyuensis]